MSLSRTHLEAPKTETPVQSRQNKISHKDVGGCDLHDADMFSDACNAPSGSQLFVQLEMPSFSLVPG